MGAADDGLRGEADEADDATKREGQGRTRPVKRLERGTLVGRYVVFDVVGEGGMGIVYNAFDPELDRRLAIKVVQAKPGGSSAGGEQARLLREAQALARLSHPNVIAVHDVGVLPGDRVFVAMELVAGVTLRVWSREPRSWKDVQQVMLAAGAGLAAAHAAGLVHRDFKPDNVIVGNDGRVRVMDFGLARLAGEDTASARDSDLSIESRSPLSANITVDGALVGTPAYMAPEIYDGLAADPRTDQFAFGVALYEALFRTRPYEKKALLPPRAVQGPKDPPATSGVPVAIQRVAMRAVAIDPSARYASMDDLLRELAVDPSRSQRRIMIAAGAAVVAAGTLAGAAVLARGSSSPSELCTGAEARLAGVWDDGVKASVRAAFGKSKRPGAPKAVDTLVGALDAYATEWTAAAADSCRATRIRGEQPEDVLALREDCFATRLDELRALGVQLASADDTTVDRAGYVVLGLEPISRCANVTALRAPAAPPVAAQAKLAEITSWLSEAKAAMATGKVPTAIAVATKALDAARQLGFDAQVAEASYRLGVGMLAAGKFADAAKLLEEAAWAGLRGRVDNRAAEAALDAALAVSEGLHDTGAARVLVGLGSTVAQRFGPDRKLDLKRLEIEGIVAGGRGDLVQAKAAGEKALATARELFKEDGPFATVIAREEQVLAATLSKAGDFAGAQPHYEKALAIIRQRAGDGPDAAIMLSGLATCYHHTGAPEKAHEAFAQTIAIRERVYGTSSPTLITTLNNAAELYRDEGNVAAGLALIERARTITETTVGKTHPYFHVVVTTQADLFVVDKRYDEARAMYDEIIAIEDKVASTSLGQTLVARAHLAIVQERWDEAVPFAERAIAIIEKSAGADAADLRRPLVDLARARIGAGRAADAKPLIERALAVGEKAHVPAAELAPIRDLLADVQRPR